MTSDYKIDFKISDKKKHTNVKQRKECDLEEGITEIASTLEKKLGKRGRRLTPAEMQRVLELFAKSEAMAAYVLLTRILFG